MENDEFVLTLDLGRSRCRAALWDGAARRTAEGAGAPGLASPGGAEAALSAILAVAGPLLGGAGVATVAAGVAGALSAPSAAAALARQLCAALPARRAVVGSDAAAAHAGALGGGPGVVLSVGTGAVALALGGDGTHRRVDGAGPWLGDEGGGAWLGLRGLRAALRASEGRGPPTRLQGAAARFGPPSGLAALMEGDADPARLAASFAPDVATAAADGDAVAAALMHRAVLALAATIRAAAAGLPRPVPAAVVGGLAGVLGPTVQAALAAEGFTFATAPGSALDGARLLLRPDTPWAAGLAHATATPAAALDVLAPEAASPAEAGISTDECSDPSVIASRPCGVAIQGPPELTLGHVAPGSPRRYAPPDDGQEGPEHGTANITPPSAAVLDTLVTEAARPGLDDLDQRTPAAIVHLLIAAERTAGAALARAAPALAAAAEAVAARMVAGGRLFTLGAGTPGRLAVLDAAELLPTFNAPPGLVIPLLAGGPDALVRPAEGAEDDPDAAAAALDAHGLRPGDAVVGIAASGRTPYVVGGLRHARARGALAVAVVNNPGSPAASVADLAVEVLTGPETIAGSTRMLAGTAQKVVLNILSTTAMIALGRTYGPWMVDVRATNAKLRRRALRMVCTITGATEDAAAAALAAADGEVKPALVALLARVGPAEAAARLARADGRVRAGPPWHDRPRAHLGRRPDDRHRAGRQRGHRPDPDGRRDRPGVRPLDPGPLPRRHPPPAATRPGRGPHLGVRRPGAAGVRRGGGRPDPRAIRRRASLPGQRAGRGCAGIIPSVIGFHGQTVLHRAPPPGGAAQPGSSATAR